MKKFLNKIALLIFVFMMAFSVNTKVQAEEITENTTTSIEKITIKSKKNKKTIKVNDTLKLKVTITPSNATNKKIKWKSSNKKIATVDKKGKVTGKKKGTVTIKAITEDGSGTVGEFKINVKNRYTDAELKYLASIIYSEAGNQCYAGKKAVGIVVVNRMKSDKFPDTIKEVLYQRGQFTPATNGSLNKSMKLYSSKKLNKDCIKAAKEVLNGDTKVKYNKKTYNLKGYLFFSGYVKGSKLQIQDHQFK